MKGKKYVGKTFEEFKRNYEGEKEPIHKLQEFGLNVCDRCETIRRSEDLFWKGDKAFCESCNKFEDVKSVKSVKFLWKEKGEPSHHETGEEFSVGQVKETGGTLKQRWELKEIKVVE